MRISIRTSSCDCIFLIPTLALLFDVWKSSVDIEFGIAFLKWSVSVRVNVPKIKIVVG